MTAEFDQHRIRQMIVLRRSLYRSRSYAIIAAVGCLAAAAQCFYLAWQQAHQNGWGMRGTVLALAGIAGLLGAILFARRALVLGREARQSHLPDSGTKPDFSTLGDGSQRAKDLEQIY